MKPPQIAVGQDAVDDDPHARRPPETPPPGELTFLLLSTRTPAVAEFTRPDGGKTAHYMLRWLSTRGEAGPPAVDRPPRTKSASRSDEA